MCVWNKVGTYRRLIAGRHASSQGIAPSAARGCGLLSQGCLVRPSAANTFQEVDQLVSLVPCAHARLGLLAESGSRQQCLTSIAHPQVHQGGLPACS